MSNFKLAIMLKIPRNSHKPFYKLDKNVQGKKLYIFYIIKWVRLLGHPLFY